MSIRFLKRYTIHGTNHETGRRKMYEVSADSIEEAKGIVIAKGLIAPFEITEHPPDPATERQIAYATYLGVAIPEGSTKQEASDIITAKLDSEIIPPSQDLVDYALVIGIPIPEKVSKATLYNLVFDKLQGIDKAAFFAFAMYRWLSDDRRGNLNVHPDREKFYSFADQVNGNLQVMRSISRYTGEQLRFFGMLTKADGEVLQGGSIQTIAYKAASKYIGEAFHIDIRRREYSFRKPQSNPGSQPLAQEKRPGCFGLLLMLCCLLAVWILWKM